MPEALVFVPFEYLGAAADPKWAGLATASIAAFQTSSLLAPAVREASLNRARHIVEGYVTGQLGALRAVATVRDEVNQRTVRTLEARGATVLDIASSLAGQITSKPLPYTTSNPEAIRELFAGNAEKAIALDPKYGSAHLTYIESLLRAGKKPEAEAAIAAARTAMLSDVERAQLEAVAARTPAERSAAFLAAARAARYDLALWRAAADAAMTAKNHKDAIEAFGKAAELDPENIVIWNTLAYAQGFAGDLEAAKRSIAEYRKVAPQDANAYDSMGEIYFYQGRFQEAEQQFLRAFEMDKTRLGGGEAYRAGLAAWLAGDKAKADAHVAKYLAFRKQNNDELTPLRESIWLYSSGRAAEARTRAAALGTPAARTQVMIWDAVDGKGPDVFGNQPQFAGWKLLTTGRYAEAVEHWKRIYENTSLINGNEARVLLAAALHGAKRQQEAQALLAKWPFPPAGADPGFSSVVFAKTIEVKAGSR